MIESLEVTLSRTAVWAAHRGDDALEMVMRSVETTLRVTVDKQCYAALEEYDVWRPGLQSSTVLRCAS
jgi:hypothetical protein